MDSTTTSRDWIARDAMVVFENSQGSPSQGRLLHLGHHQAAFDLPATAGLVRISESLRNFRVLVKGRPVYAGRAVVTNLVNTSGALACEVGLEDSWHEAELATLAGDPSLPRSRFDAFLQSWRWVHRILPEYKVVVADIQSFLFELRHWTEQIEVSLRAQAPMNPAEGEKVVLNELTPQVIHCLNAMFATFEEIAGRIEEDMRTAHGLYLRRQLHPFVLCAPFAWRTFTKPLGYAGDYGMVNMILEDPHQGPSLFARLLNAWFISQPPAEAHRNRVIYLTQKLVEETLRASGGDRIAKIFNVGCGPAGEIQNFLKEYRLCDRAQFTLLDFSEETLQYATRILDELKSRHSRRVSFQFVKKSVMQLLKAPGRIVEQGVKYDYVYCAGLFDYLPDRICLQLTDVFYGMLAPGGLLVTTNVDSSNPIRYMLDNLLEWNLLYRDARQFRKLSPTDADPDRVRVQADETGVNIFMEVRKPAA